MCLVIDEPGIFLDEDDTDAETATDTDGDPAFLNEERDTEVDIITDGGT